jgi:hypothetical protein
MNAPVLNDPYTATQAEKEATLLAGLNELTARHREACSGYGRIVDAMFDAAPAQTLSDVPYLPVRVFKHLDLKSVADTAIVRKLTSSGTSGQQVSKIYLDAETSGLQVKALSSIVQDLLGPQRLPMLIVDQKETTTSKAAFSARAAGVLGFSTFGRKHLYALDSDMVPLWDEIEAFIAAHQGGPIFLFGFTHVVWQHFLQQALQAGRRLDFGLRSLLIHGGGWKKLADQQIDNEHFKAQLKQQLGIGRIANYYGMVEQVGSIFMECQHGHLHAPAFADVLMRDPMTLAPADSGAVQVLSLLPRSYPGHSVLTEDLGTVLGVDDCPCGRRGKYFLIHGRIPMAEMRGCSDVRTT